MKKKRSTPAQSNSSKSLNISDMVKIQNLAGTYNRVGSKLQKNEESTYMLILERKKVTAKKPPQYLIRKTPGTREDIYISSLYPTNTESTYKLEYAGQYYYMQVGEAEAIIEEAQSYSLSISIENSLT